jgi:hypothetical protein
MKAKQDLGPNATLDSAMQQYPWRVTAADLMINIPGIAINIQFINLGLSHAAQKATRAVPNAAAKALI